MNSKFFVASSVSATPTTTSNSVKSKSNFFTPVTFPGGNLMSQHPQQPSQPVFAYPALGTIAGHQSNGLLNQGVPLMAPNPQSFIDHRTPLVFPQQQPPQMSASAAVSNLLKNGHKCIATLDAVISLGPTVLSPRQISLVQAGNTYGFFIWLTSTTSQASFGIASTPPLVNGGNSPIASVATELDKILPIDSRFAYELVASTESGTPLLCTVLGRGDITLKISYKQPAVQSTTRSILDDDFLGLNLGSTAADTLTPSSYSFHLFFNQHTEAFVSHLQSALESFNTEHPEPECFAWLLAYQPQDSLLLSLSDSILPEVFLQSVRQLKPVPVPRSGQQKSNSQVPLRSAPFVPKSSSSELAFEDNFCPVPPTAMSLPLQKSSTDFKAQQQQQHRSTATNQLVFDEHHFHTSTMPSVSRSTSSRSGHSPISPLADDDSESWNDLNDNDNSREAIIRVRTEDRESEYTRFEKYRIFIGTWNVNGQLSREEKEMRIHFLAMDDEAPDFYAIGFQELDLSKEAYLFDNYNKETFWLRMCADSLHPDKKYEMIKSDRLIGMMLVIFANKDLVPYISNIEAAHVGTGILGKMGNKGGVAIRFDLHETSLCFVNCHLAAHVEQYERRNQDFREIRNRLQFPQPFKPPRRIDDHNQIYWFGDLNYRVMNLSTEQIKAMCDRGQYSLILENDQLKRQKDLRACFDGYTEGPINHLPSYKYNPGTDEWDSSEKRRPPAWCDRILWRGKDIKQVVYRSHPQLKASDHKPVSALFDSSFRITDQAAKRKVYEDVMKKLDKEENDYLPQVEIDTTEINFGTVRYKDNTTLSLKLKNVGQSKIKYRFINKPGEKSYCKDWLRITPASAYIPIGESIEIRLELSFDQPFIATKLNFGLEKICDTLVLRLCGGKDIFITVIGDYRPSCFGCSLDSLVALKVPMASMTVEQLAKEYGAQVKLMLDPNKAKQEEVKRRMESNVDLLVNLSIEINEKDQQLDQLLALTSQPPPNGGSSDSIPIAKELYLLVDYLFKFGTCKNDLFQSSGSESDFIRIREALDRANPMLMKGVSVDSVAEAIVLFLQSLPEPVIPYRFYDRVVANRSNFSNCRQVINELPETHRLVFEYLVLFLKELVKHCFQNRLNATIVAKIFGPILIRKPLSENLYESSAVDLVAPPVGITSRGSPKAARSSFYALGLSSLPNSASLSSSCSQADLDHAITLNPEQTFIYHFLCNSFD